MDAIARLSVGELAALAGLTVRTLHHWDAIGLLAPSERSSAGHRGYTAADRERLVRVLALRRLGLSLRDVGAALDGTDLRAVLVRRAEAVREQLAVQRRLLAELEAMVRTIDAGAGPSDGDIVELIEVMRMEEHFSPAQRETLAERREALGEPGMRAVQEEWPKVIAAAQAEKEAGTDPADPRVQRIAERYAHLLTAFTGGDPEILASLERANGSRGETYDTDSPIGAEIRRHVLRAHGHDE